MDTHDADKYLSDLYTNSKGEAALEVGVDPGLPVNEYIQIPRVDIGAVPNYEHAKGLLEYAGKPGWVTS
ncbi:unnamed protein product, partial [Didymodactylos carnosus]